ncbi:MAG: hypothetical protein ABI606_09975 [Rhodoferax sp.]
MPTSTLPIQNQSAANSRTWRVGEHSVHFDPLLDSVVAIARIFGIATTQEALSAGLPLEANLVTPALLPRIKRAWVHPLEHEESDHYPMVIDLS